VTPRQETSPLCSENASLVSRVDATPGNTKGEKKTSNGGREVSSVLGTRGSQTRVGAPPQSHSARRVACSHEALASASLLVWGERQAILLASPPKPTKC